jgi:NADH-quinone oxidoreductase subunit N
MYMNEPQQTISCVFSPGMSAALGLCLLGALGFGFFPGPLLDWTAGALTGM